MKVIPFANSLIGAVCLNTERYCPVAVTLHTTFKLTELPAGKVLMGSPRLSNKFGALVAGVLTPKGSPAGQVAAPVTALQVTDAHTKPAPGLFLTTELLAA